MVLKSSLCALCCEGRVVLAPRRLPLLQLARQLEVGRAASCTAARNVPRRRWSGEDHQTLILKIDEVGSTEGSSEESTATGHRGARRSAPAASSGDALPRVRRRRLQEDEQAHIKKRVWILCVWGSLTLFN